MKIEQIYTGCLAQGAYYIESEGEAAIIDPLRDPLPYLKKAEQENASIKYIFETHFHADFVSGHVDLAEKTGATIIYGPGAKTSYKIKEAADGEEFKLGKVTIKVLHTPGHTPESSTYLLIDEAGKNHAIFSGDTLFIGDVGRPDLAIKSDLTQEDLAGMLYDSLRNKIMPLEDHVMVYPAHGAGSACGKNMSKETFDTLGHQKEVNYALDKNLSKEDFIKELTTGILPPPQYFVKNANINKSGYDSFERVKEKGTKALTLQEFESIAESSEILVLDTRKPQEFAAGHIPNSIFIGLDGQFAVWVGTLVTDVNQPIIFIAEPGREEEVVMRLARVGYDNALGYLEGGFSTWKTSGKPVETITSITAEDFASRLNTDPFPVLDVRKPGEYQNEHLEVAENKPLDFINEQMASLKKDQPYYIHCAGGYRSMIAASILKSRGFHHLIDIKGGYSDIKKTAIPKTSPACSLG